MTQVPKKASKLRESLEFPKEISTNQLTEITKNFPSDPHLEIVTINKSFSLAVHKNTTYLIGFPGAYVLPTIIIDSPNFLSML